MIILHGVQAATAALDQKVIAMQAATRAALRRSLSLIERNTKRALRTYTNPEGWQPAPPGEPPAWVTGNLARSVSVEGPDQAGPGRWSGRVGPTAVYGRIQELGGVAGRGSVLPPRPYMDPTFRDALPEIHRIFVEAWRAAILK